MKQTKYGKTAIFAANNWRRFDINGATKVDPNSIDDGCTDTGGQNGATTLKVDSGGNYRLLANGLFWYKPTNLIASDIVSGGIILDFPDATAGSPATSATDNLCIAGGFTSDPASMATRGFCMGIEHGGAADVRSYSEQANTQSVVGGVATARHFCGTWLKSVGPTAGVKKNCTFHLIDINGTFVGGSAHNATGVDSASAANPLYVFLFVGTNAATTFERRVQMFYQVPKGYKFT